MTEPSGLPPPTAPPPDPAAVAAATLHCIDCGYDLRGLPAENNCPECGRPVLDTLERDTLRFRDPFWLGVLAEAMTWQLAATVVGTLLAAFELFGWAPWHSRGPSEE